MAKILVVDDEEHICLLYREELVEEGHEVETAASGEEALRKLAAAKFDLVTVDIKMPGMDGLELLSKIRERWIELPIILSTAYGTYKQDFSSWASDAYVTKSADLAELKGEIRRLLAGK